MTFSIILLNNFSVLCGRESQTNVRTNSSGEGSKGLLHYNDQSKQKPPAGL